MVCAEIAVFSHTEENLAVVVAIFWPAVAISRVLWEVGYCALATVQCWYQRQRHPLHDHSCVKLLYHGSENGAHDFVGNVDGVF